MKKKSNPGWNEFLNLCSQIKSPEQFKEFFDLFLTIEEKETLSSRYLIIKALLEEKLPQRKIADVFKVSISQITRGSNALKIADEKILKFLEKHL
jgi:TrpR family transcriptional regulator, trp operon repressor